MVENSTSFEEASEQLQAEQTESAIMSSSSSSSAIYLNHAGQAWLDPQVQQVASDMASRPPWQMHAQPDDQHTIRQLYAQLIHANGPEEIAIMPSTAFAMTLVARNIQRLYCKGTGHFSEQLEQPKKHKILLLQDQMCSAVYPWQEICDESSTSSSSLPSLSLEIVPFPKHDGTTGWTEPVLEHLSDDLLLACLPPLHWSDGALLDLVAVSKVCRDKNILLVVDATQAVGIMPCSVKDIQPLVMACSIHKWLRGPPGASLVYIQKSAWDSWIPLDQHGRSRNNPHGPNWDASQNAMGPHGYPETYYKDARKFDSGGKPNPLVLPMLRRSLELVTQRVDVNTCQAQLRNVILKPLLQWLQQSQDRFTLTPGPHAYHLMGIRPTFLTPPQMLDIATRLQRDHQIYVAVRCSAFRIAPYLDTTPQQMQHFVDVFDKVCQEYN